MKQFPLRRDWPKNLNIGKNGLFTLPVQIFLNWLQKKRIIKEGGNVTSLTMQFKITDSESRFFYCVLSFFKYLHNLHSSSIFRHLLTYRYCAIFAPYVFNCWLFCSGKVGASVCRTARETVFPHSWDVSWKELFLMCWNIRKTATCWKSLKCVVTARHFQFLGGPLMVVCLFVFWRFVTKTLPFT